MVLLYYRAAIAAEVVMLNKDGGKLGRIVAYTKEKGKNSLGKLYESKNNNLSINEIAEKGYNLVPSRYIEFVNRDETQDFDSSMKALQTELTDLLKQEEESKKDLLQVFKDLGYEIKL